MRKLLLPILLVSVGFASCKKDNEDISEISQGQKFFPTQIGKYIVYNYDSTIWNDQLKAELHHIGQVRYDVADTFRDNAGRLSYVINVQRRANNTDPYIPDEVIYVTPGANTLEYKEKNLTFLKLVFPVGNGISWNGNAMIPVGDDDYAEYAGNQWNYTYANFDQPFDPGNNLYEHTVTVNQIDDQLNSPITDSSLYAYRNYSKEVYAYNVGLVYRERYYWVFQPSINGGAGSGYPKGYGVIMRAVENN